MSNVIRDAPVGQLIRFITGNSVLQYPEEESDFELPEPWARMLKSDTTPPEDQSDPRNSDSSTATSPDDEESQVEKTDARDPTPNEYEVDQRHELEKTMSVPIVPRKTKGGAILVDWYYTDDPDIPQNWSNLRRAMVAVVICVYAFVVYTSSAIYTTSTEGVMAEFGVDATEASLGLALFLPGIGRCPVYVWTVFLFVVLSVPAALATNFPGLTVLRFLQGFFGSPCLANGAATLGDISYGPRSPVFLAIFAFLTETSSPNLLLRRAHGGRALPVAVGDGPSGTWINELCSWDALVKPLEITLKDPAVLFVQVCTAIIYGICYSFFGVFPLVYPVHYGMNYGHVGLVFLRGFPAHENRLVPALVASFGSTIGPFVLAWTARPDVHWMAPTVGITVYGASVFAVMQCIFVYVPLSYPRYAASLLAGNDFFRSALAFASVLFARPLFQNLGVARGTSLLGGLSTVGIVGIWVLYFFGARLRGLSKYAVSAE
ncbi:major facilitator superfamily transporter [Jackrogersella minutella]|nr:major facilitator superfamily transporter [Jackrogersella minutella]